MYEKRKNSSQLIKLIILFSLFAILLIHSSCMVIPISTGSGSLGLVSEFDVEFLEVGKSTRSDVLLLLGNPSWSEQEDRFFTYTWTTTYVAATYYAANDFDAEHYFCIEFDETNHIIRHAYCVTRWGRDRWVSKVSEDRHSKSGNTIMLASRNFPVMKSKWPSAYLLRHKEVLERQL